MTKPPRLPPRRRGWRFTNALLGWELLRVSRRTGALTVGRFAFGAALLGVMWVLYSANQNELSVTSGDVTRIAKDLQKFAANFSLTFFVVQLTVALLLTPIFVAGSVFEERDTRSGEVLLTTDLTRREVFYGKFLARTVQVMMVVAAGMPVLALTLLWGGVAVEFIIIGYVTTFFCIFSSGAIAASVAGSSETFREGVLKAYAYILVFDVLIFPASPYLLIAFAAGQPGSAICLGAIFVPVQFVITLVSLAHGLRWLRLAMLRQRRRVTAELAAEMARRKPPVAEENPLFWKERHVGGANEVLSATMVTCSIGGAIGLLILILLGSNVFPPGWVAMYITPVLIGSCAVVVGLSAAGAVARERQKNTLIDLFMIPGGRREIMRAKLLGAFWNARWLLALLLFQFPLAALSGAPLVSIPLLLIASATFLLFSAGLGIWLSVRCRNLLNSNAAWMGFSSLFLIGSFLFADAMSIRVQTKNGGAKTEYPEWSRLANPLMGWQRLTMSSDEESLGHIQVDGKWPFRVRLLPEQPPKLLAPLAGVGIYSLLAGGFWYLALRRFESEGRE